MPNAPCCSANSANLFAAIRSVYSGHAFFSPSVSQVILESYLKASEGPEQEPGTGSNHDSRLTGREREILQLVAEGKNHQHVADILHISIRTVDTHCNNIMKKLDIHDSAGLATYAIKNGIVILPR